MELHYVVMLAFYRFVSVGCRIISCNDNKKKVALRYVLSLPTGVVKNLVMFGLFVVLSVGHRALLV